MSFLNTLAPLLKNGSTLNIALSEVNDQVQIVIVPQLAKFDADTTDPVQATLQSALAHPIRITTAKDAADQTLIDAIASITPAYQAAGEQLTGYLATIAAAAEEARVKAAEKTKAKPAKVVTKAAGAAATPVSTASAGAGEAEGEDEGDEASNAAAAPVQATETVKPNFSLF